MSMDVRFKMNTPRTFGRLEQDFSAIMDIESDRFPRTQQHFKEECDINGIMKKFERTGMLEHVNEFQGQYGEFLDLPTSYHAAVNQVLAANEMFMTIPAKVRAEFQNDPGLFLQFVDNPENAERMVELGLAKRREEPAEAAPTAERGSKETGAGQSPAQTSSPAKPAPADL